MKARAIVFSSAASKPGIGSKFGNALGSGFRAFLVIFTRICLGILKEIGVGVLAVVRFVASAFVETLIEQRWFKLKPKHELASDWTRYLLSELLSLLDGRTDEWEGWTAELAAKFRSRYHVILGGAWQDAYTDAYRAHSALGGDWSNISIADTFLDDNWMPDEILFRVCVHVIEVFPPLLADIKAQVERIDAEMGFPYDSARVEKAARAIADERSGYRGIEKHVVSNLLRINLDGPPDSPTLKQDDIPF